MKKTLAGFLLIMLCGTAFAGGGKEDKKAGSSSSDAVNAAERALNEMNGKAENPANGQGTGASAQAARQAPSRNRGQNIRLAVLAPDGLNFADGDQYLASLVQGGLNTIFSNTKYSAMTIINRQIVDTVLDEQERAASGAYSNDDYIRIGNLTNAQYILAGTIIKLSANEFSVQLGITNTETGERRTSFTKNCAALDLRQGKVINEAAAELLAGMGVELSAAEKQEILNGQAASTEAETALARGIAAQKSGNRIEAMTYMYQAASFDSSMTEATGRLNTLAVNMTGGNIGEAVQSDYQARMTWLNLFKECAAFYKDHPPFEIVYEPDLTQGDIDFGKGTVALSFRTALVPSDSGFKVLNDLLGRLEQTGNRSKWGFAGWPLLDVQPREPAAVVFGGKREFSFAVEAAILNEDGKTIASGRITLNSRAIGFSSGDGSVIAPVGSTAVFRFPNVNANDLTENLTIGITKIDGMDAGTAGEKGYIRIAAEKARVDRIETTIRNEQARIAAEQARQAAERQRLAEAEERQRAEERRLQEEERELQRIFDFSNGVITKYNGYEKTVTIPSRIGNTPVTKIGTGAFLVFYNSWRTKLTSVTIPNGIISIEDQAFIHNQLTSVTIPASVTFIGVGAFYDNPLTSITIGANVHLINDMTYPSLPRRFVLDYESQGKKAGTYVYMNSKWVKQ